MWKIFGRQPGNLTYQSLSKCATLGMSAQLVHINSLTNSRVCFTYGGQLIVKILHVHACCKHIEECCACGKHGMMD
jgi:hypothetical protein